MSAPRARLRSAWFDVGGQRMHARVSPAEAAPFHGPPLVLVHGLVISSLYMVPTAERLAGEFPVYAPDLPGFGRSDKPARVLTVPELADSLRQWMDAAGLPSAVLVGNSLGCQIAVDLAARWPGRVRGLVLAGPTMDRHARNAATQIGRWLRDWSREPPSLAAAHVLDYSRAGLRRAWRTFRHALNDPIELKLPEVQAPTLVVRGERDTIVPRQWAEEVARLLPRGSFSTVLGGPHVVNYTTPDAFAEVVRRFARELQR